MNNKKVLFLTLHTFSLTGGIEKVCRAFAKVLKDFTLGGSIKDYQVLSMYDNIADSNYVDAKYFTGFKSSKISFAFQAIKSGAAADVIVLSHINLLIFAWLIKKFSPKKRIILFAHGIEIWGKLSSWKRNFLRKSVEILAVSHYTGQKVHEIHQVPTENIKVLNNCLDPFFKVPDTYEKPQRLIKRYNLKADSKVLFTLSRLSSAEQYKGYDKVMETMAELPDHIVYILGGKADVEEEQSINRLIAENNLQGRVILTGFIADDELIDHYLLADVYVMPSTGEGFGISFIEAAACGRRSITGNQDGSNDAILHGKLGQSINPLDKMALKNAIIEELHEGYRPEVLQSLCLTEFGFERYKSKISDIL
ncbi:glycosyltransferase family 4 protein [Pedobacter aquatilis]|uniref:glycosyltransferase family 4 protein n=1 Tax=Pedobacter aquatilis TaxID=351343 RepID=UPI00292D6168|nr:glycosyltransferase family 4 protein [Pedobacter aquatilis]